jgi:hypothetical protein
MMVKSSHFEDVEGSGLEMNLGEINSEVGKR